MWESSCPQQAAFHQWDRKEDHFHLLAFQGQPGAFFPSTTLATLFFHPLRSLPPSQVNQSFGLCSAFGKLKLKYLLPLSYISLLKMTRFNFTVLPNANYASFIHNFVPRAQHMTQEKKS
jgi:hypothetical protein